MRGAQFCAFAFVLVLAVVQTVSAAAAGSGVNVAAWVQLEAGGVATARLVTFAACPNLSIDGRVRAMRRRAAPNAPFPARVCELPLPLSARRVVLGGRLLPVPGREIRRIAVIGDTGCRLKGPAMQACNDPDAWPFATIARAIVAKHPDLVVHVGDYYYRETRCYIPGCFHSPHGDVLSAWQADWFTPAAPLFAAAPIVLVRGNHETCDRGGDGWRRYLSIYAPTTCEAYEAPYVVPLGSGKKLFILDSSNAPDYRRYEGEAAPYRRQLALLPARGSGSTWIVTHRPFWAVEGDFIGVTHVLNTTLQLAAGGPKLRADAILSGHAHLFEVLRFADRRAPQFVVGDSGDWLGQAPGSARGYSIDGTTIADGYVRQAFGFAIIEGGTITGYDRNGKSVVVCTFPQAQCRAAK